MKKTLLIILFLACVISLYAQNKEKKLEYGCRGYVIFLRPLYDDLFVTDFKSELGVGIDIFANIHLAKNRLYLNTGVNIEKYSHKFLWHPNYYEYYIMVLRPDVGLEYRFIHRKSFSSGIILGTPIYQQYLYTKIKRNNQQSPLSSISEEERKFIYPYAMLKCSYSIKEKYHVGLFIKANFYPDASFSDNITEEDLRLSSGLEFRF